MAIAFCFNPSLSAFSNPNHPFSSSSSSSSSSSPLLHLRIAVSPPTPILRHHPTLPVLHALSAPSDAVLAGGGGDDHGNSSNNNNNGGNNGGDGWGEAENAGDKNREEALMVLAGAGRVLESLPKDLKSAIEAGRLPGAVVEKFLELEKFGVLRWLMQFGGFKERLLADDLFLAKVFMECGVGIFTKTAAEYERRREKFFDELEIVFADVVLDLGVFRRFSILLRSPVGTLTSILVLSTWVLYGEAKSPNDTDFMLVYLPAPTVALRPPLGTSAGAIAKFFHNCPDNAFQVALAGTSYSFLQRFGAIVGNGTKLFAVGTASSLVGTAVTNALINARKAVDKAAGVEVEKETLPILSTSAAYGVYMAVSSNLRYQVLAGVIEQRLLEPLLHKHKLMLGAISFAVRTGNTFLGSLLWVDYARWLGLQ